MEGHVSLIAIKTLEWNIAHFTPLLAVFFFGQGGVRPNLRCGRSKKNIRLVHFKLRLNE